MGYAQGPASFGLFAIALGATLLGVNTSTASALQQAGQPASEPTATAPAPPEASPPNTVSVDLSKINDPNAFRNTVTRDQRIHVHIDFGRVFEIQGNFEAALLEYQQALAACERKGFGRGSSADEALAHRRIGNALDRLGRFKQAEVHYRKAVKLTPKDPKVWNDAAYSYYLQGRWAEAERTFKTALKLTPDDVRLQTNLGLVLAAAGRTKEALPLLSKYSGDAVGHANLGYMLAATGQVELAKQQYLQALALRPNLEIARRALTQLERSQKPSDELAQVPLPPPPVLRTPGATQSAPTRADEAVVKTSTAPSRLPPPRHFVFPSPSSPPSMRR
jgi:Flp pilus assembly protein TadD